MAYYDAGATHFEHQDWMGSERARTSYNGAVEGTYSNLPYGDAPAASGTDGDPYHYAVFDHDPETATEHAEFRQYSSTQGRFMSPDPYGGSYNPANPQSFNRYAYALNSPLSNIDPSGLDCFTVQEDGSVKINPGDCPGYDPNNEYYYNCDGCVKNAQFDPATSSISFDIGPDHTGVIWGADYTPTILNIFPIYGSSTNPTGQPSGGSAPNNGLPTPTGFKATLPGMNYCGPGGHCYDKAHARWTNNVFGTGGAAMQAKIQACNAQLCSSLSRLDELGPYGYSSFKEGVERQSVEAAFGCKP